MSRQCGGGGWTLELLRRPIELEPTASDCQLIGANQLDSDYDFGQEDEEAVASEAVNYYYAPEVGGYAAGASVEQREEQRLIGLAELDERAEVFAQTRCSSSLSLSSISRSSSASGSNQLYEPLAYAHQLNNTLRLHEGEYPTAWACQRPTASNWALIEPDSRADGCGAEIR